MSPSKPTCILLLNQGFFFSSSSSFFWVCIDFFLDRKRNGEGGREWHIDRLPPARPLLGINSGAWALPWWGIKPATFPCAGAWEDTHPSKPHWPGPESRWGFFFFSFFLIFFFFYYHTLSIETNIGSMNQKRENKNKAWFPGPQLCIGFASPPERGGWRRWWSCFS